MPFGIPDDELPMQQREVEAWERADRYAAGEPAPEGICARCGFEHFSPAPATICGDCRLDAERDERALGNFTDL